jgi:acetyl esterase
MAEAADEPHPEIAGLLNQMGAAPMPEFASLSPDGARQFIKGIFPEPEKPEPVGDTMELTITERGIPIRVYIPEGDGPYPTLVYYHGGGWVIGDLDTHDETCRVLASESECMVISVEYRLSPEHTFPVPLEDCYAALEWASDNAVPMQIDTDNLMVGGDSAGGNLAAAVALYARDDNGPEIARQVLIYPVTDHSYDTPSYQENGEGGMISEADMKWFWNHYLENKIDGQHPYVSPLKAHSLAELPSATVVTCGLDPLRDEGAAYAQRLRKTGIDVTHHNYDDCIHGIAQMLTGPMELTRARELLDDVAGDISRTIA